MNNIFSEVVFTGGDKNFGAGDFVAIFAIDWLSLGFDKAEIGSAMRLGQTHRSRPYTFNQLGQIERFLRIRAKLVQRFISALGEAGIHAKTHIRRADHFLHHRVKQGWHAHATIFAGRRQTAPTSFGKGAVGFFKTFGRGHIAIIKGAAFLIAAEVKREEHLFADLAAFFDNLIHQIIGDFFISGKVCQLSSP